MELLLMVSTLRRASARSITAVIPYYGYARQDRKTENRVSIAAADVARLLETMGVNCVISVDLHCWQIEGFFDNKVPVINLEAGVVGMEYMLEDFNIQNLDELVVVSPDAGGVSRAKKFQEFLI
jgi:ribose-phosphate pyrophosphokinase